MKRRLVRSVVAFALFAVIAALLGAGYLPPLPNPLTVDLLLDPQPARSDPIVVGGVTGAGDFLTARFRDERTLVFVYDSWGMPGLESKSVKFEPGRRLHLELQVPILHQVRGTIAPAVERVRVVCDGVTVLDARCHFYVRQPGQLWLGENPLGGSACGTTLHGKLWRDDGREIRGTPERFFSAGERLRGWFVYSPWQPAAWLLLSFALAFYGVAPLRRSRTTRDGLPATFARLVTRHRWFAGAASAATLVYAWLVTGGSFNFNYEEVFGNFYDHQALSLMQGRLDVPDIAIGGEAFVVGEKTYGYFGPTPAILRLPFLLFGVGFGKLSRPFMVLYFVGSLLAAYLIFLEALHTGQLGTRRPRRVSLEDRGGGAAAPADYSPNPSPWAVLILVGSVGLGSTIFFLGSRGLIFHEAILGGIVFALWSCGCALRHLRVPGRRWWIGALICGVLSIHTRPPTGLFALPGFRRFLLVAIFSLAGLLSLNGLAFLKFGTFDAAPLRISRPYTDPGRLERIEGKSFHAANVPYNFYTYVLRPNLRVESQFPWIYIGARTLPRAFPEARIDLPDHTLAIPYAMPSLFALATLGCLGAVLALPGTRAPVAALWIAVLPMTLALFAAVATAQRYTGDFVPFLVTAGMFGLAAVECAAPLWRAVLRTAILLLTLAAMAVTVAITLHYQGDTLWGVPEQTRENYKAMRVHVDAWFNR